MVGISLSSLPSQPHSPFGCQEGNTSGSLLKRRCTTKGAARTAICRIIHPVAKSNLFRHYSPHRHSILMWKISRFGKEDVAVQQIMIKVEQFIQTITFRNSCSSRSSCEAADLLNSFTWVIPHSWNQTHIIEQ